MPSLERSSRLWWLVSLATLGNASATTENPGDCAGYTLNQALPTQWGHTQTCQDPTCGNGVNPPTGGPHCGTLLACSTFTSAPSRCQWIHNLEHGHLVLAYNCPSGCADIVSALQEQANKALKDSAGRARALVVADPQLPKKIAAIVAGWSYVSDTVDEAAIGCIAAKQDAHAPEAGFGCIP